MLRLYDDETKNNTLVLLTCPDEFPIMKIESMVVCLSGQARGQADEGTLPTNRGNRQPWGKGPERLFYGSARALTSGRKVRASSSTTFSSVTPPLPLR